MAPKAVDLLTAEIALRAGRVTEAAIADSFAHQADLAREGKSFSLGQILIKRRKLSAEEFLEALKRADEPLISCHSCREVQSARQIDERAQGASEAGVEVEPACVRCGNRINVAAAARGLPNEALALKAPPVASGPLARRSERGRATARAILSGDDKAAQGIRFGRYEILSTLGIGGMGVVYKARQVDLDRVVALKVLREGEGARDEQVRRFIREAQSAAKLQHPGIVAIHEVGCEDGIHFFTMDFVEGETLHEKFQRGERLDLALASRIVSKVAAALHYAHQRNVVHRDLKPGNVIIAPDGEPKLTDFGLAKTMGGPELVLTRSGVAIGTPLYMSPEQARGDLRAIDGRSDVFSCGVLLYQAFTGVLPFYAESHIELYNKILYEDPDEPRRITRDLPFDLQTICLKALEKKPRDRYQSAKELGDDLDRWLRGEPIRARPLGPSERLVRAARRNKTALLVVATALIVAGLGLYLTQALVRQKQADLEAEARGRAAAEARRLLAEVAGAVREGRPRDALERAAVLYARFPDTAEAAEVRFHEGAAELALGRTREALGAYARAYRAAAADVERARALSALAGTFVAQGDHDRALECLAKLLGRYPATPAAARAELEMGKLLAELDDAAGARKRLEAALAAGAGAGGPLGPEERRDAEATLAWLDRLHPALEMAGAEAGATGDASGDGRPELIVVRHGALVAVERGPEGLIEVARGAVAGPRDAVLAIAAGDVTGDGAAEVILAVRDREAGPALLVCGLERTAPPTFVVRWRTYLFGRVARGGLAVGDVDGDGRGDIVVASAGGSAFGGGGGGGAVRVLRSAADGFEPIPLPGDLAARGPAPCAIHVADLDKDGRAEIVVGAAGPAGDDVRIYRWNAGAGGFDVEWRQKVGPVVAALARDLDGDARADLAIARAPLFPARRREEHLLADGLHLFRPSESGKGYAASWRDAIDGGAPEGARVRGLAAGDIGAGGGASLVVLFERARRTPAAEGDRLIRVVRTYAGFAPGPDGLRPVRRDLVFRDRAVEWIELADLDADGDDELIVGGPELVKIYGARGPR